MAVVVYRSTDASAPVLSGTAGTLVALLTACLVNGYGSQPGAGWARVFTGTNAASYRAAAGNRLYLDVNDAGPGTATTREARMIGYETMSALATGTNPFPTAAQSSVGVVCRKATGITATAIPWILVADDRSFYLFAATGDAAGRYYGFAFGELYSFVSGDAWRTLLVGGNVEGGTSATQQMLDTQQAAAATVNGQWLARSYLGGTGGIQFGKYGDPGKGGVAGSLQGVMPLPNPVDGAVWLAPVWIGEASGVTRGRMRGFYHNLHTPASFADGDTIAGSGSYAGRTFLSIKVGPGGGVFTLDATGPWDSST